MTVRLYLLVEGQTEEQFVKLLLAPHLAAFNIIAIPIILATRRMINGRKNKGGVSTYKKIAEETKILLGDATAFTTTLIDYYGIPDDFPEYQTIQTNHRLSAIDKVTLLEKQFQLQLGEPRNFIPFFALHEFEAWVFCAPAIVAEHFADPSLKAAIGGIVTESGAPEWINHGSNSHPSKRLGQLIHQYKKTTDGPTILKKAALSTIRSQCPHFAQWLDKLERLGH